MIPKDLTSQTDFAWRLRVLMEMADIRFGELAEKCGMSIGQVYKIRAGEKHAELATREKLLKAIERWKPGTLKMMRAAELNRIK